MADRAAAGRHVGDRVDLGAEAWVHPVDHQCGRRHAGVGQLAGEVGGLLHGVGPGGGDQDVGGGGIGQHGPHGPGPGAEALLHPLEGLEEGHRVLDDLRPGHLGDRPQEGLGGHVQRPEVGPGGEEEGAEEAVLQEVGQPAGRVEQVEGVAGRRACPPPPGRRPGPRSARRASPWPCTPGCPTGRRPGSGRGGWPGWPPPVRGSGRSGRTRSSKVPLVSSMRACSSPGQSPRTTVGELVQRLDAQRVGQAPGRVDRDDAGPPPVPGRLEGEGGRHRGLADATGAAAHHHGPVGGQRPQRRRPVRPLPGRPLPGHAAPVSGTRVLTPAARASARRSSSAGPMAGADSWGRRSWGRGSSRPRRSTCSAASSWRWSRKRRAASRAASWPGRQGYPGRPAAAAVSVARPVDTSSQPLTTTGPSWTPARSSNW